MKKEPEKNTPDHGPILEHVLLNQHESAEKLHKTAENHMQATAEGNKLLENHVEAAGQILDEHKKTNEHLEKISGKDVQKVELVPPDDEEDEEDKLALLFWKMLRGRKGEKGDSPTDEALIALIKPLIPDPIQGEKGEAPTKEDLLNLILPLIPKPKDGKNGKDGHTPTKAELTDLILTLIPEPKTGAKGKDGTNGRDGKDAKISAKLLLEILKGKISYDDLKDLPNLDVFRRQSSRTVSLIELDDVNLTGLTKTNGKYNLGSGGGSSGNSTYGEIVAGSNTTFTLAATPTANTVRVWGGGSRLTPGVDFTIVGAVITTVNSYDSGQVLADYNY